MVPRSIAVDVANAIAAEEATHWVVQWAMRGAMCGAVDSRKMPTGPMWPSVGGFAKLEWGRRLGPLDFSR